MSGPTDPTATPTDAPLTPEASGDARVDAALERLSELADRPVTEHVEVYESVHGGLADALADLDD